MNNIPPWKTFSSVFQWIVGGELGSILRGGNRRRSDRRRAAAGIAEFEELWSDRTGAGFADKLARMLRHDRLKRKNTEGSQSPLAQ